MRGAEVRVRGEAGGRVEEQGRGVRRGEKEAKGVVQKMQREREVGAREAGMKGAGMRETKK